MARADEEAYRARVRGCLLGGAIGDALGGPVEFSTGAICGNILGVLHGETALPAELVFGLEGRGTILQLADDFVLEFTRANRLHGDYGPHTAWRDRYTGW